MGLCIFGAATREQINGNTIRPDAFSMDSTGCRRLCLGAGGNPPFTSPVPTPASPCLRPLFRVRVCVCAHGRPSAAKPIESGAPQSVSVPRFSRPCAVPCSTPIGGSMVSLLPSLCLSCACFVFVMLPIFFFRSALPFETPRASLLLSVFLSCAFFVVPPILSFRSSLRFETPCVSVFLCVFLACACFCRASHVCLSVLLSV